MTLDEAIKIVNKRSTNINLNYYICEWNGGYIIHDTAYMKRNPNVKFVYSTGEIKSEQKLKFKKLKNGNN